jgi:hypothetical protein
LRETFCITVLNFLSSNYWASPKVILKYFFEIVDKFFGGYI